MNNNQLTPLDQLSKAPHLSNSYGFLSTKKLIELFKSKGWTVDSSQVSRVRNTSKQGFQKHLIRFSHPDFKLIKGLTPLNESKPQIVLVNSHDGTTAVRMFLGLFRFICTNGLVSGVTTDQFKARHTRNIELDVTSSIDALVARIPLLAESCAKLQSTVLDSNKIESLISDIVLERLKGVKNLAGIDLTSAYALPARDADKPSDAFTMLNRVQEKLVRGGIRYQFIKKKLDKNGNVTEETPVWTRTKQLRGIGPIVELNKQVYNKFWEAVN